MMAQDEVRLLSDMGLNKCVMLYYYPVQGAIVNAALQHQWMECSDGIQCSKYHAHDEKINISELERLYERRFHDITVHDMRSVLLQEILKLSSHVQLQYLVMICPGPILCIHTIRGPD